MSRKSLPKPTLLTLLLTVRNIYFKEMRKKGNQGAKRAIFAGMAAAALVTTVSAQERQIHDTDGDGWCDLWCSIFQVEHRNEKIDSDADGITDFKEMLAMTNPFMEERPLTKEEKILRAEAAKDSKKRKSLEQKRMRKMLEPFLHEDLADSKGKLISVEEKKAERRFRMGQKAKEMKVLQKEKGEAAKMASTRLGLPSKFDLEGGGVAVLSGKLKDGVLPTYTLTRSSTTAADTISVDNLWPGGSSGFDLTGMGIDSEAVRIGVWEPQGLLIDHPEFITNLDLIDSADGTAGWTTTGGGFLVFNGNANQCQEGSGCLDMRRPGGSSTTLFSRQQPSSYDFSGRTIAVWFYFGDVSFLTQNSSVQLRFGSSPSNYWQRTFNRENLVSGWNLLSMTQENATNISGSPVADSCSYTALNVSYQNPNFALTADGQSMDYWRLSDTRVQNMDRASSVGDHSTHTTGIMASSGDNPDAKGMAFGAQVHSRDALNDLTEMMGIFSNSDTSDNIFTANHSYGPDPGWTRYFAQAGSTQ